MLVNIFTPTDDSILNRYAVAGKQGAKPAHWLSALMLVWTIWIFFVPMFQTGDQFRNWLWPTLASFALFLWLYWRTYYRSRAQIVWNAWGMAALGLVLLPFNPGAQCYFIYACAYFPYAGSRRRIALAMICALTLYTIEWIVWLDYGWVYWINGIVIAVCIGIMNLNFMRKAERDVELRMSHDEVRRLAATAERERIGRDLHDLLGHTLSLITLKLELAHKLHDRGDARARQEIGEAEDIAREALAQVRSAVTGIRASDLAGELASARLLLECQQVHLQYAPPPPMPVDVERGLALVLREAATNIVRHAQATQARVEFMLEGRMLAMQIRDDGRGGVQAEGNGLCGMRERAMALGGQLSLQSPRGEGTVVTVRVPLVAATTPLSPASLAQDGAA